MRPAPAKYGHGFDGTNIGSDFTEEEWRFGMACDHWKREHNGRMPSCAEVLAIAKSLGYRKPRTEERDERL